MIKQIIFDCDGVLVDTEMIAAEVMVKMLAQFSIHVTIDDYLREHTGKTFKHIIDDLAPDVTTSDEIHSLAHQTEEDIYAALRPISGMPEMVGYTSLPKALVSNSKLWQVEKAVRFLGINEHLTGYFSAEMVSHPKPSPDIYLYAASTLKILPEQCLVIEDSLSGVKAAVAAGMNVIGFTGASHILPGHDQLLREHGALEIAVDAPHLKSVINQFLDGSTF